MGTAGLAVRRGGGVMAGDGQPGLLQGLPQPDGQRYDCQNVNVSSWNNDKLYAFGLH
jgi:hypothetical protein